MSYSGGEKPISGPKLHEIFLEIEELYQKISNWKNYSFTECFQQKTPAQYLFSPHKFHLGMQ